MNIVVHKETNEIGGIKFFQTVWDIGTGVPLKKRYQVELYWEGCGITGIWEFDTLDEAKSQVKNKTEQILNGGENEKESKNEIQN